VNIQAKIHGEARVGAECRVTESVPRKIIIRGSNVNKRYVMGKDNFVDALQDASLEIHEGEMIGVMGPSGSGKSTLVHILGCLDSADSGEVWLDGRRVDNLGRRELSQLRRNEIGFIFQTFNLVPSLTALENVMLAAEYAGKKRSDARAAARGALARVGLAEREDHKPTELSGGQQQRVAIARALVNGPKVIFGDEPTGNLDSASSHEIVATMHDINRETGTTFVLVTHDAGVAATCDRVVRMLDGRVTNGWHDADGDARSYARSAPRLLCRCGVHLPGRRIGVRRPGVFPPVYDAGNPPAPPSRQAIMPFGDGIRDAAA
jgi:putative ABC transport system ATP-binding protein